MKTLVIGAFCLFVIVAVSAFVAVAEVSDFP